MPIFFFPDCTTEILHEPPLFPDCGVTVPELPPALPSHLREGHAWGSVDRDFPQ